MIPAATECDIGLNLFVPVCKNTSMRCRTGFFEYMMAGLAAPARPRYRRRCRASSVGIIFPASNWGYRQLPQQLLAQPHHRRVPAQCLRGSAQFNWEVEEEAFYSRFALAQWRGRYNLCTAAAAADDLFAGPLSDRR
jgi:hypothetical protein